MGSKNIRSLLFEVGLHACKAPAFRLHQRPEPLPQRHVAKRQRRLVCFFGILEQKMAGGGGRGGNGVKEQNGSREAPAGLTHSVTF